MTLIDFAMIGLIQSLVHLGVAVHFYDKYKTVQRELQALKGEQQ
jgi:hypothetical protein